MAKVSLFKNAVKGFSHNIFTLAEIISIHSANNYRTANIFIYAFSK